MRNAFRFIKEILLLARGFGLPFTFSYLLLTIASLPEVLASGSLGAVDKRVTGMLQVKSHGFVLRFKAYALPVVREIHLHDCYGFDATKKYKTVLDLGSNTGTFSALAAKVAERVIAVECNTTGFLELFHETMQLNGITNAIFINRFAASNDIGNNISINKIVAEYGLDSIDFLKMDIEGSERELFSANLDWLGITKAMAIEVHPCFGVKETELISLLTEYGFKSVLLDKNFTAVSRLPADGMGYIRAAR